MEEGTRTGKSNEETRMTDKELIIRAAKKKNAKVAAWIRKAGGINNVTEERAARIAKLCKLKGENYEKSK